MHQKFSLVYFHVRVGVDVVADGVSGNPKLSRLSASTADKRDIGSNKCECSKGNNTNTNLVNRETTTNEK